MPESPTPPVDGHPLPVPPESSGRWPGDAAPGPVSGPALDDLGWAPRTATRGATGDLGEQHDGPAATYASLRGPHVGDAEGSRGSGPAPDGLASTAPGDGAPRVGVPGPVDAVHPASDTLTVTPGNDTPDETDGGTAAEEGAVVEGHEEYTPRRSAWSSTSPASPTEVVARRSVTSATEVWETGAVPRRSAGSAPSATWPASGASADLGDAGRPSDPGRAWPAAASGATPVSAARFPGSGATTAGGALSGPSYPPFTHGSAGALSGPAYPTAGFTGPSYPPVGAAPVGPSAPAAYPGAASPTGAPSGPAYPPYGPGATVGAARPGGAGSLTGPVGPSTPDGTSAGAGRTGADDVRGTDPGSRGRSAPGPSVERSPFAPPLPGEEAPELVRRPAASEGAVSTASAPDPDPDPGPSDQTSRRGRGSGRRAADSGPRIDAHRVRRTILGIAAVVALVVGIGGVAYLLSRAGAPIAIQVSEKTLELPATAGDYTREGSRDPSRASHDDGRTTVTATYQRGGQPQFVVVASRPERDAAAALESASAVGVQQTPGGACGRIGQRTACAIMASPTTALLGVTLVDHSKDELIAALKDVATAMQ